MPDISSFRDIPDGPELIRIPRGYFRMGSDHLAHNIYVDETPARECSVSKPFAVAKYPVTPEDLLPFLTELAPESDLLAFMHNASRGYPKCPAVAISWHEANAYCEWLSASTARHYRLLTETEWEYVCRAGTESSYYWGDDFEISRANSKYHEARNLQLQGQLQAPISFEHILPYLKFLTPVDKYLPNPWGVFDMSGNTWDWVEDIYSDRRTNPTVCAPTAGQEPFRCLRGGSWMDPPLSLRCATRNWADPAARDRNVGFRVARDI
jgi:formylglycine-generating enzyme required for sulfatase activity